MIFDIYPGEEQKTRKIEAWLNLDEPEGVLLLRLAVLHSFGSVLIKDDLLPKPMLVHLAPGAYKHIKLTIMWRRGVCPRRSRWFRYTVLPPHSRFYEGDDVRVD